MTLEQLQRQLLDPQNWLVAGAVSYYVYGFIAVRHIYQRDEERVGATPFDRMAHVLLFVIPIAAIWPIPWMNWICRESEAAAIRREERARELEARDLISRS